MLKIDKKQAEAIRKKFKNEVHITIANKQSSHKKYWVEKTPRVKNFLKRYEEQQRIIYRYGGK